jgi:hypothetical protein
VAELRLGYKASAEQFGPRELVELGVLAEAHGMDSASVSDHFNPWRHEGGHSPFALSWMTAVGERTKRIMLGTSVLTPTFRYNPAVIAQAFATMGCLYPGRVFLGVGTGEALNEIATGAITEWPEFKERFANMGAQLVRQVASKTNDEAGDGTTTATVLARAIFSEGCKSVAAGLNPMDLRRGMMQAVAYVTEHLKSQSVKITSSVPKKVTGSTLPQPEMMVITNQCMAAGMDGNTSGCS